MKFENRKSELQYIPTTFSQIILFFKYFFLSNDFDNEGTNDFFKCLFYCNVTH